MPKVLTEPQIRAFETQGVLSPVRVMSTPRARSYRERFESLEARHAPDIKKMKTKSHLLCPWVLEIAEDPYILDVFEDLIGPDLRCWSMAWRVKKADGQTFAGWHQDSAYGAPVPVVLGALALSDCGPRQGCLRGLPGSHALGVLRHEESADPRSILARGQYIVDAIDESRAIDFALEPGEMSPEELIRAVGTGFYVTELIGHGANMVTGEYSRGASGFWIENGELAYPVSEVTIASNLADMFLRITPASDIDRKFGVAAPTLAIEGMTLAGL